MRIRTGKPESGAGEPEILMVFRGVMIEGEYEWVGSTGKPGTGISNDVP